MGGSGALGLSIRRLFWLAHPDTRYGAKVIRRGALDEMLPVPTTRDLTFDVDLLLVARDLGYRVVAVPVRPPFAGRQQAREGVMGAIG